MIVALTGFMGCGKSSVGRALAQLRGCAFIDLDEYIVHKAGDTIRTIFERDGLWRFRALEAEAVRDIITLREFSGDTGDLVLALGGGTFTLAPIRKLLLDKCKCVFLEASPESIRQHLAAGSDPQSRPLLQEADIDALLEERTQYYAECPVKVVTDGRTVLEIAADLVNL